VLDDGVVAAHEGRAQEPGEKSSGSVSQSVREKVIAIITPP
jgi:hypothetical protein